MSQRGGGQQVATLLDNATPLFLKKEGREDEGWIFLVCLYPVLTQIG